MDEGDVKNEAKDEDSEEDGEDNIEAVKDEANDAGGEEDGHISRQHGPYVCTFCDFTASDG